MGKILIKLVNDNSSEEKTLTSDFTDGLTLDKLIEEKIANAGWTNRNLVIKSTRLYDTDFNEFIDITMPLDTLTLADKQRFEIRLNKAVRYFSLVFFRDTPDPELENPEPPIPELPIQNCPIQNSTIQNWQIQNCPFQNSFRIGL
ncbi:hypothetical protein WR25_24983 [Diploscapter pachys]|uniref:Uncharacterized protein n=1 Tax=Diploscapter pachys TaxID=2018661 RepID=A0A2A2LAD2_9BILA|nr:hypothetical protein WR25_24983 [Diploscapter pachys]